MIRTLAELGRRMFTEPADALRDVKMKLFHLTFHWWERLGVHVVPNHFHYPIPDTRDLQQKEPWNQPYPETGMNLHVDAQLRLLEELEDYLEEYSPPASPFARHGDAHFLYAMVRHFRPDNIIEVGSGTSTAVFLEASRKNQTDGDPPTRIRAVEPYPGQKLRRLNERNENLTLVEARAEDLEVERYLDLESGDFLFIDSSHVASAGSDVNHLLLRVLPRIPQGVLVHFHDIFLPNELPKQWLVDHQWFWTEQYLLHAFLMFNHSFEVVWTGNYLSQLHPEQFQKILSGEENPIPTPPRNDRSQRPKSAWIRRTGPDASTE